MNLRRTFSKEDNYSSADEGAVLEDASNERVEES